MALATVFRQTPSSTRHERRGTLRTFDTVPLVEQCLEYALVLVTDPSVDIQLETGITLSAPRS